MLQTKEGIEIVPTQAGSLDELGEEYCKDFYLERIGEHKEQIAQGLTTIAGSTCSSLGVARRLVKRKERGYRESGKRNKESLGKVLARCREDLVSDLSEEPFMETAFIKIAVIDVIEAGKAIRSDRWMVRKLNAWERYLDNQPEQEFRIRQKVEDFRNSLEENKNSKDLSDKDKRVNRKNILDAALKELKREAPEEVLRKLLEPDRYRPRKETTRRMLALVEARRSEESPFASLIPEYPQPRSSTPGNTEELFKLTRRNNELLRQLAGVENRNALLEFQLEAVDHWRWLLARRGRQTSGTKEIIEGSVVR